MKPTKLTTALAICLTIFATTAAQARFGGGEGYGDDDWQRGGHHQNRQEMVGDLLGLTGDQEQQIETIRAEEWEASREMREKLWSYREEMRELTDKGSFDEKEIRALAEEQAKIQVELAVSKARMHSRIHALMTPEQQELTAKLRAARKDRRGQRRGPGRGGF